MNNEEHPSGHRRLIAVAGQLAPHLGYNKAALRYVRILRTETVLNDIPVLYKPGAVFVM